MMAMQKVSQKGSGATSKPAFNLKQFEQDCLDEHNRLRALHGCPPLKINENLSAYATEWAKKLALEKKMEHRAEGKYGENIFMASGISVDGKMPVINWYNEITQYNYNQPSFKAEYGHFTQLIWKDSKELGIGIEKTKHGTWVVVNYNPPGNYLHEFGQNVPKPLK